MIPPDFNELTPPLIQFSLYAYIDKYCVGMEQRATVDKPWADYLRDFDKEEKYIHIEPSEQKPTTLFYVYPIKAWRESCERRKRLEEKSERDRQIRLAIEESIKETNNKIQRRRDILAEAVADALKSPAAHKLSKHPKEFTEYLCFKCLIGEADGSGLGITKEIVEEFKTLPHDPDWVNKYWTPTKV